MSSSGGVKAISRFVEWILSFYQSAIGGFTGLVEGSGGGNGGFGWLARSWKGLFLMLLLVGAALNVIIFFIRWKPHWWWFAKKRMVVDDALINGKTHKKKTNKRSSGVTSVKPSTIVPRKDASQSLKLSTMAPSPLFLDDSDDLFGKDDDDKATSKKKRGA